MYFLQEFQIQLKDTNMLNVKDAEIYRENSNHKQAGMTMMILDKNELDMKKKTENIIRDKKRSFRYQKYIKIKN